MAPRALLLPAGRGRVGETDSALGVGRVREKRDGAGALQRVRQRPLVLGARAGDPARQDLAPLGQEPAEAADLLVVDVLDALDAEGADLAAGALGPAGVSSIGHWSAGSLLPGQNGISSGSTSRMPAPASSAGGGISSAAPAPA